MTMINLDKEREAFEKLSAQNGVFNFSKASDGSYKSATLDYNWHMYVKGAESKQQEIDQLKAKLAESDQQANRYYDKKEAYEALLEKFVEYIADLFNTDFGEHSSCNDPFRNALDELNQTAHHDTIGKFTRGELVLVPRDPTEKMYIAGVEARQNYGNTNDVYKAMIEAAQEQG